MLCKVALAERRVLCERNATACCEKLCKRDSMLCVSVMAHISERNVALTQMAVFGHHESFLISMTFFTFGTGPFKHYK